MEAITRLVADSLARHGLDRPVDPRRLLWSRWSRCDSPHSLLVVPSKPGIFALAEEVMDLGTPHVGTNAFVRPAQTTTAHVGTDAFVRPVEQRSAAASIATNIQGPTLKAAAEARRMLAVIQFAEDDDMAFTLDRMFTRINPMRDRLSSGRCFLRFVVIEDQAQRRSICAALNQWMLNSSEKATGIPAGFSTSLELSSVARAPSPATADSSTDRVGTDAACPERSRRVRPADSSPTRVGRTLLSDSADTISEPAQAMPKPTAIAAALNSGAAKNLHCPHPLPSGF
jgi:hypothetical protein